MSCLALDKARNLKSYQRPESVSAFVSSKSVFKVFSCECLKFVIVIATPLHITGQTYGFVENILRRV